jgi:hypothetical protein
LFLLAECQHFVSEVPVGSSYHIPLNTSLTHFCEWTFNSHVASVGVLDLNAALCLPCECGFVEYGALNDVGQRVLLDRVCELESLPSLTASALWVAALYHNDCTAAVPCSLAFHVDFVPSGWRPTNSLLIPILIELISEISEYRENQVIVGVGFLVVVMMLCIPMSVYWLVSMCMELQGINS